MKTSARLNRTSRPAPEPGAARNRVRMVGGGVIAALIAAEAAAQERAPDTVVEAETAPAAASLEEILDFAEICRTRGDFGRSFGGHAHDRFTPRFYQHADDDHAAFSWSRHLTAGGAAHGHDSGDLLAAHGSHSAPTGLAGHEAHAEGADGLTFATPAEHGDAHEAPMEIHVHDLDAGLDALIAAHAGHVALARGDPGLAAIEAATPAEAVVEASPVVAFAPTMVAAAPASHHHHGGADDAPLMPVIVTVEI